MERLEELRNQVIELAQDNMQLSETLISYLTDLAMQLRTGQITQEDAADSLEMLAAIILQTSGKISDELERQRG